MNSSRVGDLWNAHFLRLSSLRLFHAAGKFWIMIVVSMKCVSFIHSFIHSRIYKTPFKKCMHSGDPCSPATTIQISLKQRAERTSLSVSVISVSKFKARISDVIKPEHDDYNLLKWLKGEYMKRNY